MSTVHIPDYLDTYQVLEQATENLGPEELRWKASPESWSITEVLTHLADHNFVVSFRIRDLLADTTAQLPAFNQDAWVYGQKANESGIEEILKVYQALLQYNSLLFGRLTESDWNKTALNFKGEPVTAEAIVSGFIRHVHHHVGQINRIKEAFAAISTQDGVPQA
ncbi:DinB family protein [Paenibacillus sp. YPG26]|uniref:DinB family protein n=1 Tax=Paenibacillus sp. YPG26 TaxID=2878915 RepID=UPI00203C9949|nr:DinB family protein [Paenibacillus sp. YPG26]USB32647.1 DinB family protein [Paenibacillus sp. YPG26]